MTTKHKGTDNVILLRDGTLITDATNSDAKLSECMDFVYMGDLKGIAERFNQTPDSKVIDNG